MTNKNFISLIAFIFTIVSFAQENGKKNDSIVQKKDSIIQKIDSVKPKIQRVKIDGIAAVVGDNIVLNSDIYRMKTQLKEQGIPIKNLSTCDIMESLLQDKMFVQEAKKDTLITVSEKEITGMVSQQIDYMKAQLGSMEKVLEFYNKKTLKELKDELSTLDKNRKYSEKMKEKIVKDIDVSPEEIKNFYDKIPKDKLPEFGTQVELYQIVIKPKPDKEEVRKVIDQLKNIKKSIEEGSSFRTQAVLYSQDPGSRADGGKYVINRKSGFVQEFKDVAFSLDEGSISEPFKTQFGWHILQVEKIKGQERVVRHILLVPEIGFLNQRSAKKKLDSIRKRILDKELDFEEAAKAFSDDENTKKMGGKVVNPSSGESLLDLTTLDPKIFKKVEKLNEGDISEVYEEKEPTGKSHYRILYVKKKIPAHKADYVKDYVKIKQMALEKKKEKVLVKWMNEKIKNNYIKINKAYKDCKFQSNWIKK